MNAMTSLSRSLFALLFLTACGGPSVELGEDALRVVHTSPHHGAVDVAPDTRPAVGFNRSIGPTSRSQVRLEERGADGAFAEVDARWVLRDEGRVVIIVPRRQLTPGAEARIRVGPKVQSADGVPLGAELVAGFRVAEAP